MLKEAKHAPTDESDSSSSEDSSGEEVEEVQVESLVAGRSRRSTAGNRLSSLIEKEGDDELELLFAEADGEEDVEFAGDDGEEASDVQLESSSDDEDQGPTAAADDLEGEKELQKLNRQERRKKRKAQEVFKRPPPIRHRVKFNPTITSTLPATSLGKPKKKSERISWLPTPDEGPTRSSSRKQTMQNKEVVHQRMQQHEKRRRQQIEVMEAAAKRKEASKPKAMTQADRLAEAARTEKKNAKSLNRWEETEKKRVDDQKARLAALQNRQLKGPVITWWSGQSKWVDGNLVKVGKEKDTDIQIATSEIQANDHTSNTVTPQTISELARQKDPDIIMDDVPASTPQAPVPIPVPVPSSASQNTSASLPSLVYSAPITKEPFPLNNLLYPLVPKYESSNEMPVSVHAVELRPPPQPLVEYSARNLVILENVDADLIRTPELQNHVLLQKQKKAATKTQSELEGIAIVASC